MQRLGSSSVRRARACALALLGLVAFLVSAPAMAQVVDADLRTSLFVEPSKKSHMTVLTPSASVAATPVDFLTVNAGWAADVVSGASEPLKAGPNFRDTPDIVSAASVTDFRQVATGGLTAHRGHTDFGASYSYGTEHDYRSNAITATASSDFFQRNTKLEVAFSHGFDEVCDLASNARQVSTERQALDSSKGCFTSAKDRRSLDVSIDNFQGAWTQSWTPVLATQLVLTGSVLHGFLSNPYRSVVVGPSGEAAQEHHPDDRARAAAALRVKYYVRALDLALGAGVRAYHDTWDITSQSYELDVEKNLLSWLRLRVNGRYYRQTAALFWSDDYTGGEPANGPRGQYFSGDRELSPLSSVLGGGRVTASFHGRPGQRIGRLFLDLEASFGADMMRTFLSDFTWAGRHPDDTTIFLFGGNLSATF
jgi:hypothetical protein